MKSEAVEQEILLSKINPAPYNPRRKLVPGDRAYEDIKRSIEEFGLVDPLVWNKRSGNLVGGHQRHTVLKDLGVDKVRVRVVDLTPAKEKALNIALNRISGDWDEAKLTELLGELEPGGLLLTGFDAEELRELVAAKDEGAGEPEDATALWVYPPDDVVEEALKYFRRTGFPYPKLELFEMKQQINKLAALSLEQCPRSTTAYQVADTYNGHRFHASAIGMKSPVWGFEDDKRVRVACRMELDAGAIRKGYLGAFNLVSRVQPCANFRPAFAKLMWEKYGGKGGVCFDPSMGYGGRLVGFLASRCKTYIATDPNVPTFQGNKKLAADLGKGRDIWLFNKPVEDLNVSQFKGKADVAFTSPPYFAKEIYSDDDTQSWKRYPTHEGWLEGFLTPMIRKCGEVLRPGGHLVLNIEDVKIKGKDYALVEPTVARAKAEGFKEVGREAFPIPKSIHNADLNADTREYDAQEVVDEAVLVFQKPGGRK
jgi:hypothetical protein